jgi:hypothetical protein
MLAASHRERVACEMPVSVASLFALIASGPSIRRTIRAFTLSAYSIIVLGLAPRVSSAGRGDNYPDAGEARHGALADVGDSPLSASNRRSSESETSAPAASSDR